MKRILIVFLLLAAASSVAAQEKFPMITIPEEIADHVARAKYLGEHYWDNVDFNAASDEVLEQGFVDMVSIFALLDDEALDLSWAAAVKRAEQEKGRPSAIVLKTVKGKGVSFMENQVGWHGKAPNEEQYRTAMEELTAALREEEAE